VASRYAPKISRALHPFDHVPGLPCRDDPESFVPEDGKPGADAIAICEVSCPITAACLTFALQTEQKFGVWGGTGTAKRLGMSKQSRAAAILQGEQQLHDLWESDARARQEGPGPDTSRPRGRR
jgi:WhiB family transcriptional regulator, redox-sensing transcriptional regulator